MHRNRPAIRINIRSQRASSKLARRDAHTPAAAADDNTSALGNRPGAASVTITRLRTLASVPAAYNIQTSAWHHAGLAAGRQRPRATTQAARSRPDAPQRR